MLLGCGRSCHDWHTSVWQRGMVSPYFSDHVIYGADVLSREGWDSYRFVLCVMRPLSRKACVEVNVDAFQIGCRKHCNRDTRPAMAEVTALSALINAVWSVFDFMITRHHIVDSIWAVVQFSINCSSGLADGDMWLVGYRCRPRVNGLFGCTIMS